MKQHLLIAVAFLTACSSGPRESTPPANNDTASKQASSETAPTNSAASTGKPPVIRSGIGKIWETHKGPYCLTVKFDNNNFYFYSEVYAQAWVTHGTCESEGSTLRVPGTLRLEYLLNGGQVQSINCDAKAVCAYSERFYGIGRTLRCASAVSASDFTSTQASTGYPCF